MNELVLASHWVTGSETGFRLEIVLLMAAPYILFSLGVWVLFRFIRKQKDR